MSIALYTEIADHLADKIIRKELDQISLKAPEVWAEYAGLNVNVVRKAYDSLVRIGVLKLQADQYLYHESSRDKALEYRREGILTGNLPDFLSVMNMLEIQPQELKNLYESYLRNIDQ
ncbi:MAG TPA: hypothetical protein VL947_14010 [Cytophagales bacterium]|nr:hypothetical protein [Cytophagales bacterium]